MSKKQKKNPEAQALALLNTILPKAVSDQHLVAKILSACQKELESRHKVEAFEKFCTTTELPNLETETVKEVQRQFEESFGSGTVSIVSDPENKAATVEVVVDEQTFSGVIKVGTTNAEGEEEEFKPKFVPFPVALPADPELIWMLGRAETVPPEEASIALNKVEEDFWASKAGQQLLRDRVERSFPEFIARVPAKLLTEVGLKRHYKEPEPLKELRVLSPAPAK